ncbi:acyltransferase [Butyrivibrio sp. INlla16]|uniref:acyltransferase family protein n=1 Tax=Butyrivibrio sp. INlla16 TaxID=1520807 RepID=UPI000885E176|nr:acyltransferase [Butyrivibrio sp. INlla16]SDB68450.1 Fucose 4-O-acetylase [Butyrivibrio sp. INlla16]
MKNKRFEIKNTLGMFDLLKGIIMILVVVSHTEGLIPFLEKYHSMNELFSNVNIFVLFLTFIYMIVGQASMPALLIISGYGFRKTTNTKCITRQYRSLLQPYIITMAIAIIIHFFSYLFLYGGLRSSIKQTVSIFLGALLGLPKDRYLLNFRIICCGPTWFLLALIIATIVFNFLANRYEEKKLLLISLFVSCIGWLLSFTIPLPWCISQGFISVFFLGLGYYVKKNKLLISFTIKKLFIGILIIIPYLISVNITSYFDMANDLYPLGPISIIANAIIGFLIIYVFLLLNRFNGFLSTFIRKIGRNSLYFLCIHSVEMVAIGGYVQYMFVHSWWKGNPTLRSAIIISFRLFFAIVATLLFVQIKDRIVKARKA